MCKAKLFYEEKEKGSGKKDKAKANKDSDAIGNACDTLQFKGEVAWMRAVEALRKLGKNGRGITGAKRMLGLRFLVSAKSEAQGVVQEDPDERLPEKCLFEPLYYYNVMGLPDNCTKKEVAEQLLAAQIEAHPIHFAKTPKKGNDDEDADTQRGVWFVGTRELLNEDVCNFSIHDKKIVLYESPKHRLEREQKENLAASKSNKAPTELSNSTVITWKCESCDSVNDSYKTRFICSTPGCLKNTVDAINEMIVNQKDPEKGTH
jgi:hypothetical protein